MTTYRCLTVTSSTWTCPLVPFVHLSSVSFGGFSCCCQSFSLSYCQLVNKLEDCYIWIIATGDSHSDCINRVISFLQSGLIVLYNCFQRLQRTLLVPVLFALIKTCLWKSSLFVIYFYYIEIRHTKAECIIINTGFKKIIIKLIANR